MLDAVLAPRELTVVRKVTTPLSNLRGAGGEAESYLIPCNLLQTYTTDSAYLCAEIPSQQVFAQADALENLSTTIGANGRDTHFRHNLFQPLIHSLDIVFLSCCILFLNFSFFHQIVEDGKCNVWA